MKRIKIFCGICKGSKCYSIVRGIKKVSSVIACENCQRFYLKLKKNPFLLDCISPIKGSCFKNCSFMKTRCKCCWAMQILDSCPHPNALYSRLSNWLSEDCKKLIRGKPISAVEVDPIKKGKVIVEIYQNNDWVEASSTERELSQLLTYNNNDDDDEDEEQKNDKIEMNVGTKEDMPTFSMATLALEAEDEIIDLEEEAVIDDPAEMETDNSTPIEKPSSRVNNKLSSSKSSERIKRKRKKVEYFTKPVIGRKVKGPIYGSDGKINKTGMDLCDCLQVECVGCHFPCPKCRSPKCGNECRVNRRWYYEKVEVEGTKMSWVNRFVPKI